MGKRNNGYGYSGYGGASAASANVRLPDKVPCGRCQKRKGHSAFAKNRLDDLKAHVYKNPRFNALVTGYANCMECSGAGAQQLELECIGCERTLPHTAFAKTQRRNKDNARCMKCQNDRNNEEPGAGSDDDDSGHGGSGGSADEFDDGVSNMGTRVSNLSVTDGTSGGGVSINSTTSANSNSYASASTSGAPSTSNRDAAPTNGSWGTDDWATTNDYATSRSAAIASSTGTAQLRRHNANPPAPSTSGNGKWAKVRPSDAKRDQPFSRTAAQAAAARAPPPPAPGVQDDDDIGVADSDSDSD